jgi:hypothetical protein
MIKAKITYKKPCIKTKKTVYQLLFMRMGFEHFSDFLSGTCPSGCRPPNSCGSPSEPAYCLGNQCAC